MFNRNQFMQVLDLQYKLNEKAAGADWTERKLPWDIAVIREIGEAFDHLGWEWWKPSTPNIAQAQMEIIDIIHFIASGLIVTGTPYDFMFDAISGGVQNMDAEQMEEINKWGPESFLRELVVNVVTGNYGFALYLAIRAGNALGMDTDQIFNTYIAKNVLNGFRKANGYKEGTYIKMWHGREDNEHLNDALAITDLSRPDLVEYLTAHLDTLYRVVKQETEVQ